MDKKYILALVLITVWMLVVLTLFKKPSQRGSIQRKPPQATSSTATREGTPRSLETSDTTGQSQTDTPPKAISTVEKDGTGETTKAKELKPTQPKYTTVTTKYYDAEFNVNTATISGWELRKYHKRDSPNKTAIDLIPFSATDCSALRFTPNTRLQLDVLDMKWESEKIRDSLIFRGRLGENLEIIKRYTFRQDSYIVDLDITFHNLTSSVYSELTEKNENGRSGYMLRWGPGITSDDKKGERGYGAQVYPKGAKDGAMPIMWAAMHSRYFSAAIIPALLFNIDFSFKSDLDNGTISEGLRQEFKNNGISLSQNAAISLYDKDSRWLITDENENEMYAIRKEKDQLNKEKDQLNVYPDARYQKSSLTLDNVQKEYVSSPLDAVDVIVPGFFLGANESRTHKFVLYIGPKESDLLKQVYASDSGASIHLNELIHFGFFGRLGLPQGMIWLLNGIYGFVGNYGVAIIIITTLMKILTYPLTHKSYQSMQKMQALKEPLEELKEKYRDDPQKLNKATMRMYKEHGTNPLSGCIVHLPQIPIFWAFFSVLREAIELRGESFLWAHDLSLPDTIAHLGVDIRILPLLMGVSMFLQQRMTGTPAADPRQSKLMGIMPVFMTFIFYRFPSGLTLYWFWQNVLTIIQQYIIGKIRKEPIEETTKQDAGKLRNATATKKLQKDQPQKTNKKKLSVRRR